MKFATRYADIRRHQDLRLGAVWRRRLRYGALDAMSAFANERALARPRVQLLCLHHVMADEEPRFRELIERLMRHHTFVSYSDAVARVASGAIDRPYVAVTFDDGLRNQLRAAEILRDYAISACFFVCEAMLEPRSYGEVRAFCHRELGLPPVELLSWSDVETLLTAGHEIGNHTSHHPTLAHLTGDELENEIGGSRERLCRRLGSIGHFAWPRGRWHDFSAAAAAEVFRAGHVSCASAIRGCHLSGPARSPRDVCLRRDHVVACDPLRHTMLLLARGSGRATGSEGTWPQGWEGVVARAPAEA